MSIKVMSAVFDRYQGGGGEMLLALALTDHARDRSYLVLLTRDEVRQMLEYLSDPAAGVRDEVVSI